MVEKSCTTGSSERELWVMPSEGGVGRLVEGTEGAVLGVWSPDGQVTFRKPVDGPLWRVSAEGGDPELLTEESVGAAAEWSRDGQRLFFFKRGETSVNIWALSIRERSMRSMTDLAGRHGRLHPWTLADDEHYLYFVWREDVGDIWVMDVVE